MKEQNITLVIGDNASGKTRYLKKMLIEAKKDNLRVVTNIPGYKMPYGIDKERLSLIKNTNNRLIDKIVINEDIETSSDAYISDLLRLLYSRGDVLIIDELDVDLTVQEIVDVAAAISDIRKSWSRIYVNGYSEDITRIFIDKDHVTYTERYIPNILYVDENMNIQNVLEAEECEYFDKIRG